MRPLTVSLFPHSKATKPEAYTAPWSTLRADLFENHERRAAKDGPAIVPGSFATPERKARNVGAIELAVLDVDKGKLTISDAADLLAGYEFAIYSTHSHTSDQPAFRVVLPLAAPVPAVAWPEAFRRASALLRDKADQRCKDPGRLFFLPACPPERAAEATIMFGVGRWLDLGSFVDPGANAAPTAPPPPTPASPDEPSRLPEPVDLDPEEILARLPPDLPDLVVVAMGQPFPPGERDARTHAAVSQLVFRVPQASEAAVVRFFEPTIAAMAAETPHDPIPLDKVAGSYHRARSALEEQRRIQATAEASARVRLARAGGLDPVAAVLHAAAARSIPVDLATPEDPGWAADPVIIPAEPDESHLPYSEADLGDIAAIAGCDLADLERRWLIQRGSAYFVLTHEGYKSPITKEELPASLPRDLARAPVELFTYDRNDNPKPRNVNSIVIQHATVARFSEASLIAQRSSYDPKTETFTEAVAPIRPIAPAYHEKIATWLELLGGKHRDRLLDWVATVTNLSLPTCAIYLIGPPSAGKTMLAQGLARLWTTGAATSAAQALDASFNSAIAGCPLIFADEALPRRMGQRSVSAELRELIGSTTRPLKRKYLSDTSLHGAIRMVLAANNDRLLDLREDLDTQDQIAVAQRFLAIHVPPEAAEYLASIGGRAGTAGWVDGDKIAEHALWLSRNRKVTPAGRWIVEGVVEEVHERLAVSSGVAGLVVEWICRHLVDPGKVNTNAGGTLIGDGKILVNPTFLADFWEVYVQADKIPSLHAIGRALRNLAAGEKEQRRLGGRVVWFWPVRVSSILRWAEDNLVGDVEAIRTKIETATDNAAVPF